jgi:hypothetical protein
LKRVDNRPGSGSLLPDGRNFRKTTCQKTEIDEEYPIVNTSTKKVKCSAIEYNPLEALGLHEDLQAIEQVMIGPTHLVTAGYRMLADSIVKKVLAAKQGKRKGDMTHAGSSNSKRGRSGTGQRYRFAN